MKRRNILVLILIILLSFTFVACGELNLPSLRPLVPEETTEETTLRAVEVLSVNGKHTLEVDSSLQLIAIVYDEDVTANITFSSNDETIATVNNFGVVTGVSTGLVKITVKASVGPKEIDNVYTSIHLTIVDKLVEYTSVTITGEPVVYIDEVNIYNLTKTPTNANEVGFWQVDNEQIATIDQSGRLTSISEGSLILKYVVNDNIFATFNVEVVARTAVASEMTFLVKNVFGVGDVVKAYVETIPKGAINDAIFTSSDDTVATVDEFGYITGLKAGVVTITATLNSLVHSEEVEIVDLRIDKSTVENNKISLAKLTTPSVFGVSNYQLNENNDYTRVAIGSGFVYKVEFHLKNGTTINNIDNLRSFDEVDYYKYYLITNRHVVEDSDALKIYMGDTETEVDATLVQYDSKVDIAIVVFNFNKYIRPLPLGDSDQLSNGKTLMAVGNPQSYDFSGTTTYGEVSNPKVYLSTDTNGDGMSDWDSEYILHQVPINPGNSGGPLIDLDGNVVGINTLKYASEKIDLMGFSIPINAVKDLIPFLEAGEKPLRAKIGVVIISIKDLLAYPDPEITIPNEITFGHFVKEVVPGSVADSGGVLPGDIIIMFNNVYVTNSVIIRSELGKIVVGSNTVVTIQVYRNGQYIELDLTF